MSAHGAVHRAAMRVVLANASEDLRVLMTAELSLAGIEVVADVVDGRAAVDAVAAHQPDAVVLAEVLPEMSGSEAARLIRVGNPRTRIVFFTALKNRSFPDADRVVEHSNDPTELARVLLELA